MHDEISANAGASRVAQAVAGTLKDAARYLENYESELRASEQRLAEAQRIGHMGSYDWDITKNTNQWSDELYRIYGTVPQSFDASYEKFLEFLHPDDRAHVMAVHQHAYETGEPYEMQERIVRPDGETRTLLSSGEVLMGPDGNPQRMRGVCQDITDQLREREEAQALGLRLHDSDVQRRHALEINDNVVQGLTAAIYAFESGFSEVAVNALRQTLAAARTMMDNLLGPAVDTMVAGDFTRAEPAPEIVGAVLAANSTPAYAPVRTPQSNGSPRVTIFLIDDAEDIRVLLRYALDRVGEFSVIGEAADGAEALEMIRELTPAVVVVDLAMPKMDGLEVISALRDSQPGLKIIALSGFDRGRMEGTAIAAGADAYLEKGTALRDIAAVLTAMVSPQEPLATR